MTQRLTKVTGSSLSGAYHHDHSHRQWFPGINLDRDSMKTVYEKFGLESGTQDFVGHAMALYLDDECVA